MVELFKIGKGIKIYYKNFVHKGTKKITMKDKSDDGIDIEDSVQCSAEYSVAWLIPVEGFDS